MIDQIDARICYCSICDCDRFEIRLTGIFPLGQIGVFFMTASTYDHDTIITVCHDLLCIMSTTCPLYSLNKDSERAR
jgi:hypothetical protein